LLVRQDSDALFVYLRSIAAVTQHNQAHALRFPYNTQLALMVWRALYFRPHRFKASVEKSPEWNRGAYLVQGLGHCGECHSPRSSLGGVQSDPRHPSALAGGLMAVQKWYAPSLRDVGEAGLQGMAQAGAVALLKHGVSQESSVLGPMAEVVYRSIQYFTEPDLVAMTRYLQDLPGQSSQPSQQDAKRAKSQRVQTSQDEPGRTLYKTHCADCHGDDGQGAQVDGRPAYPRLAGNRAVTLSSPLNLIRVLVQGGFPPSTMGNPRPFGMPPFSHTLSDSEIAQVLSYIRQSWGNTAGAVYSLDVVQSR
jgi:mono/diheme cytochrome c family protein